MSLWNQEDSVRPCIDLIDSLRSLGVEQDLALPAVAVIGDQSSGKSSVLEALSGVELPRGRTYPLVLRMRRTKEEDGWCGIVTYHRNECNITKTMIPNPEDVKTKIEEVIPWNFSLTSEGFLCLDIASSTVPNLTLVDLPSLPTEQNTTVQIKSFLKKKYILVVVPCNVDIAEAESMKMAKDEDPTGLRTLGVLTKPDLVDKQREKVIVDIVQNKVPPLNQGYVIVKCQDEGEQSVRYSIKREKAFFRDHALFKKLYDDGNATVPKLAERLTLELQQHIEKSLPILKEQVKNHFLQDSAELKRYGFECPSDAADKLTFLTDKVTIFTEDTGGFLTGELLELIDKKIFSEWRYIVQNAVDTFTGTFEEEVAQYEQKHKDRMQSGFMNYNSFKSIVKEHIGLLEEPAVLTLKDVTDIVKKELQVIVENNFAAFPKLQMKSQNIISDVILTREKTTESTVRMQFKMEQYVHLGDNMCSNTNKEDMHVTTDTISNKRLNNMMVQLKSYYHTASQRLAGQIPLVIRFQMLQELSTQLQKEMLQMVQNKPDTGVLLREDSSIRSKRNKIQSRFKRLTKACILLSEEIPRTKLY
ncbi:interferon-induced GTP-binding protein Mx-like [Periophthalmus magnuspinnatus]|uniref:interferon-induced GTP-binding protein Mx-like n=1 Tax=Periophthalmus magnuspinnatus TaxID=409849 RepID=UPI0024363B1E|nr:interferon-induced GTP-binding protein Mx-like [Periophthalmus magnuspinnatus]